jgi:gluconokinase
MWMKTQGLIVMGVAGSGKSSIGKRLAEKLGGRFFDADNYHSPANIEKMRSGIPLDDADREPWLAALHDLLAQAISAGEFPVLACSALKQRYRDVLLAGNEGIRVVYLRGGYDLILGRMRERSNHYMKPEMLRSQFAALEEPNDAVIVDIARPVPDIIAEILAALSVEPRT